MPLFEVVVEGRYKDQQIINRWNYLSSGTPAAVSLSFALAWAFGAIWDTTAVPPGYAPNSVFPWLRGAVHTSFTFIQATTLDVYSPTDFYQVPLLTNNAGQTGGEGGSPALAYKLRTNVVRRDIRRGQKAIRGVSETMIGDGGIITGTFAPQLNGLAAAMSDVLEYNDEGNTITFTPVVVGKQRYNPATGLPDADGSAYRYYPTFAEQADHLAQGVVWGYVDNVRTQRSSQYGNGS